MFRILSFDGGGIKGAFSASVLATFEEEAGMAVVDHFDLITDTSSGGILAQESFRWTMRDRRKFSNSSIQEAEEKPSKRKIGMS
jgi:predicted patatin/cPLA2 family phospholipase